MKLYLENLECLGSQMFEFHDPIFFKCNGETNIGLTTFHFAK